MTIWLKSFFNWSTILKEPDGSFFMHKLMVSSKYEINNFSGQ